jgi:lipoprotein-anchoring transpeptidase ErfK/SrfK
VTDDDLERTLRAAFDAKARASISDAAVPPAPRFAGVPGRRHRHPRARVLAPLAAAAAVITVVVSATALQHSPTVRQAQIGGHTSTSAVPSATRASGPTRPVHIKLLNADGSRYGIGMPVIAYFSKQITDAGSLSAATSIAVNGKPVRGAWYFERSAALKGYPVEGHLRMASYWPAHAKIHVGLATKGVTAGNGLAFDDALTLDFSTGPAMVAVVDDRTHTMRVDEDGKAIGTYPVSLGSPATPTMHGIKVIMQKGDHICMSGPGYHECNVRYTQRLTYAGEYLHAAPWNTANIGRVDSSNGCTNLMPADAQRLYKLLEVGDVVEFPNAAGPSMRMGNGFGDWNVPWSTWQTGGLVPTR